MPEVTIVGEAKDGEEVLKCVDELDLDLLITDIYMPKLNGWQVLHHLQERQARTKVIVFSAYANPTFATVVQARGVFAYINKENPQALANAVKEAAKNMNGASS
jgi:YesN/AraC family two-component response regulator